jgi:hypothetical protein
MLYIFRNLTGTNVYYPVLRATTFCIIYDRKKNVEGCLNSKEATFVHNVNEVHKFVQLFIAVTNIYEGHLESKERFAIKKYLLIIGKKKYMQVLSHTFTYFST